MKICFVAYKFGTEKEIGEHLGTYHYFIEITKRLVKLGHEVEVIAPRLSFFQAGSRETGGVKISRYFPPFFNIMWLFPLNRLMRFWYIKATQKQVLKFTKKIKPEAVIVWQARETGYAVSQIKDRLMVPFIFRQITTWQWHFNRPIEKIFSHKKIYQILKKIKLSRLADILLEFLLDRKNQKKFAQIIYAQADVVAFVSQIAAEEGIEMGLDKTKTAILPVCIETEVFKPLANIDALKRELNISDSKIVLFIGRINFAEKGVGYLLEAFKRVVNDISEAKLVIIGGGGESERMFKMIVDLGLEKNVLAVGKKPFADLVKYINLSQVFVVPSVWLETFGQVTIEAMACGVPVVTFDAGASPDINLDGQTGFVVPAKDSVKLAQAVIKLLNDKELRQSLGQNARQRVLENYTYEVVINDLLNIIQKVKSEK